MNDFLENRQRPFSGISTLLFIDKKLFIPIILITIIGLITIFSSSDGNINLVFKQLTRIILGVIVMIFIAQVNPDNLRLFAPLLYFFTLILLMLVLFLELVILLIVG